MRSTGFILCLCIVAQTGFGQHANNTLLLTVSGKDRISVVKSSVHLAAWHEKAFWPLYEAYLGEATDVYAAAYRSLHDLAETDATITGGEAFQNGRKLLTYRGDELELQKKYYRQVGSQLNGVIALQFLQTEAMMDMLESAQVYNKSQWQEFRFHPQSLDEAQQREAKHNIMNAALALPADKEAAFWSVYSKYEEECDALLGEGYTIYTLFASDAADFTPAIAMRLGNDLLQVMERELKLKEKYFKKMNAEAGSTIAARFLAWEDYYSIISKMYAWAETP